MKEVKETVFLPIELLYGAYKINNSSYRNSRGENTDLGLILTSGKEFFDHDSEIYSWLQ